MWTSKRWTEGDQVGAVVAKDRRPARHGTRGGGAAAGPRAEGSACAGAGYPLAASRSAECAPDARRLGEPGARRLCRVLDAERAHGGGMERATDNGGGGGGVEVLKEKTSAGECDAQQAVVPVRRRRRRRRREGRYRGRGDGEANRKSGGRPRSSSCPPSL
jgi:hypothetical protein